MMMPSVTLLKAALTIENFVELSRWGMDDKVGCYAYLHTKKQGSEDVILPKHMQKNVHKPYKTFVELTVFKNAQPGAASPANQDMEPQCQH